LNSELENLRKSFDGQLELSRNRFEDELRSRDEKLQNLTLRQEDAERQQQKHEGDTSQAIKLMQRKVFEAQKANQDAFHARETLVQPDEQLDNNDRDMIDSLIKNPGIGAIVLSVVLFVGGIQLRSKFKPDEEFSGKDAESEDSEGQGSDGQGPEGENGCCCTCTDTSSISGKCGWLWDKMTRSAAASFPIVMLAVQFSYIFFIFDEAYDSYSGEVCPAFNFSVGPVGTTVPPLDGPDARIRILMGFVGLYFTARTLSQMYVFLRALTDRTVSNKDIAQRTWTQGVWETVSCVFACCKGTAKKHDNLINEKDAKEMKVSVNEKEAKEMKISRLKGHECSSPGCGLQGFYYTKRRNDVVELILTRMHAKTIDTAQNDKDNQDGKRSPQDVLKHKALMEFGVAMFVGRETVVISQESGRIKVTSCDTVEISCCDRVLRCCKGVM
jgi:hypothetical protein